jgi:hypothetical protein
MSAPKSPEVNDKRRFSDDRSHDRPSSSLKPGEDDGKQSVVSTTVEQEEPSYGINPNMSHLMEADEDNIDDDDDNRGNTSDTGTATTTSTSELTTGMGASVMPGASPPSEIVAVTATASASSAVGLHGSKVGGNGANNLTQLSIANN